jgi:RNA polymerase sigma factor (sigma-70 family)
VNSGRDLSGDTLEQLASRAVGGDRPALEALVRRVQDPVYRLALRMLWHPEDARDATQEILIRIVTRLGSFRGESALLTWVYRVAANYLLTARRSRVEEQRLTFEAFGADLEEGLAEPAKGRMGAEEALLVEEVKIGCTLGMLACLDRPHRLAYVLGEILEMDHEEAARVLETTPAAFRKRLSRARGQIVAFTRARCGLVDRSNACRCRRRVPRAIALGRVDPRRLLFARDAARAQAFPEVLSEIRRLEILRRAAALYRSHPDFSAPEDFTRRVRQLLEGSATRSAGT